MCGAVEPGVVAIRIPVQAAAVVVVATLKVMWRLPPELPLPLSLALVARAASTRLPRMVLQVEVLHSVHRYLLQVVLVVRVH